MKEQIEDTAGYRLAMTFKPFISDRCIEHMEIVKDMARAINSQIKACNPPETKSNEMLIARVRQFLTALNYESLNDFQGKCALLLEQELKTHMP